MAGYSSDTRSYTQPWGNAHYNGLRKASPVAAHAPQGSTTTVVTTALAPDPPLAITQAAYQFFDDAGTESGAASLAALNTPITGNLANGDGFGVLRVRLQNTTGGLPATDDWQLQWEKNASGTWTNVTTSGTTVIGYDNPNLTDGAASTNRLGAGSGSFFPGKVSEDGMVDDVGLTAGNYTEVVYSLKLLGADFVDGDTLRLRVVHNASATEMTYAQVPTINIARIVITITATRTTTWGVIGRITETRTTTWNVIAVPTRSFNGTADVISFNPGSLVGMTFGTVAALWRMDNTQTTFNSNAPVALDTSTNTHVFGMRAYSIGSPNGWLSLFIDGNFMDINWPTNTTTWRLVVLEKGTGSVAGRVWIYDFTTGTWTTDNVALGSATANAARTISKLTIGQDLVDGTFLKGQVAAVAVWKNVALTDAQVKTMNNTTSGYTTWTALSPTVLKILDQPSVATAVVDEIDATSTQTAITGTTIGGGSPFPDFLTSVTATRTTTWNVAAPAAPKWTNHVAIAAPRNGTTTHTVDPSSGTVVTGTAFTPTAGRFLLCVVDGSVTSTTPTGWTLPTNGSAINNTGLYIWYRTAAGGDTFTTTHNGSNFPVVFDIYEFPAGTTFVSAASGTGVSAGAANPTLSALTGTNTVMGAAAISDNSTLTSPSATWNFPNVEAIDTWVTRITGSDGYWFGTCYQDNYASATYAPTPTILGNISQTTERLTWALNIGVGSVAATRATTWNVAAPSGGIGTPTFTAAVSTTGGTSATNAVTTASFTPGANDVVLAHVVCAVDDGAGSTTTTISLSNTGFGTLAVGWTRLGRYHHVVDGVPTYSGIEEIWACQVGPSPSSGTVTVTRTAGSHDQWLWASVCSVPGAGVPSSPNIGTFYTTQNGGSSGSGTATLASAPASTSAVFGVVQLAGNATATFVTPPTGFTEAADDFTVWGDEAESAYKVGSASQANTWTWSLGNNNGAYGLAVEIPVASASAYVQYRAFNGTSDQMQFDATPDNGTVFMGPGTTAICLVRTRDSTPGAPGSGDYQSWMALADSVNGTNLHYAIYFDPSDRLNSYNASNGVSGGTSLKTADGAGIAVLSNGTSGVPRSHIYKWGTGVWNHTDFPASVLGAVATGSFDSQATFQISNQDGWGQYLAANVAVVAYWNRALSDTEIATLNSSLDAWYTLSPLHLWRMDEATVVDAIGAAEIVASSGTTLTGTNSPLLIHAAGAVYSDDFNRANGALGSSWTNLEGLAPTISSNAVVNASGQGNNTLYNGVLTADQWAEVTVASGGSYSDAGPAVRMSNGGSGSTHYKAVIQDNGLFSLWYSINGSLTQIGSSYGSGLAAPFTATLRIEANGTTIKAYLNGVERFSVTDSNVANGKAGICTYNNSATATIDNFRAGDLPYTPAGGGTTTVTAARTTTWNTLAPVATAARATTWVTKAIVTPAARATTWNTLAAVGGAGVISTPTWTASVFTLTTATAALTTASITPAANDVVTVVIDSTFETRAHPDPTFTITNGAGFGTLAKPWQQIARAVIGMDGASDYRMIREVWACKVGASPAAGTVTVTRTGVAGVDVFSQAFWIIAGSIPGADIPTTPNLADGTAGGMHVASPTATGTMTFVNPLATSSMALGILTVNNFGGSVTQPSGWTEVIDDYLSGWGTIAEVAYKIGSAAQSTSWSWTASNAGTYGLGVEIPAAVAAANRSTTWNTTSTVTASRATTWAVLTNVPASRATTWNVAGSLVNITASRATSWATNAPVTPATRTTTWNTAASITANRATTWATLATGTPAARTTTWATLAPVTPATRATTWAVLTPVTAAARTTRWNTNAVTTASRATTWTTTTPVTPATRATTWVTKATTQANRATTWNTNAVSTANRATTWATLSPVTTAARTTTWNVVGQVTATRTTSWSVAGTLIFVQASRTTTWNVSRTVTATRATTWDTKATTTSVRATTWNIAATIIPSRTTTWTTRAAISVNRATTWVTLAPVTTASRATTWNVRAQVTTSRVTTWNVIAPIGVVFASRSTTWDTLGKVTPATRVTSWSTFGQVPVASRTTTWVVRSLVTANRATAWVVLAQVSPASRTTTWNVSFTVLALRLTLWQVRGRIIGARTTNWKVAPAAPTSSWLTLYPNTIMYIGTHQIHALYQGGSKIWP